MGKVQWVPWWWVAAGIAGLAATGTTVRLPAAAWAVGVGYLVVSTALLMRGIRRGGVERFGPANAVTATRSVLVGLVTALVVASFAGEVTTALLVGLVAVALALDGVDGYVARRTRSESELGARFDMEVDAFLLLVLCVYDVRYVGWWVLTIGLLRYAFVVAGFLLPWMRQTLPPRYWRKVVTAACGVALAVVASQLLPPPVNVLVAVGALLLVLESFGRDVLWLARLNLAGAPLVSLEKASTSPPEESR
ncbi:MULTISPECIES: CDP-alcohol phosphatidyltransferase family protein [Microbacterium]|uniref:CDP-alcohol phosphatidyltransferase n=1 Tax=Microbacterium trichothecenolyticum TaxID=69370 RepID=A0A0M2HBY5_MICTR|nr:MULTISPECIES: CDP-alcohol phosphatidyltransferase family protein [Microbacterium]KJL41613.1 CDP-alcohol phosphatidyltransferase [Microbacterium trichothecenolyticum]MDR7190688.1 phosphatidylglycerophosphate synthase [Microbacterium sp. BE35]